ncbi:OB-fold domain-containing protein [Myxococcota bacterium]|nr:OB-fold domain-containing protein [Myxococcota bacterium]
MSQLPPVTYDIEYPYTRTTGPVVGAFLTALRDGRILASRCGDRVICPPVESDPETGESIPVDLVEVGPMGTIQNWTWIEEPSSKHPFQQPFAFALVLLDGADTPICHAVRASGMEAMSTGMRVRAQWREERASAITDVYFVPEADAEEQYVAPGEGEVELTEHLISLSFQEDLQPHRERYSRGLLEGRFVGQRSPASGKVYIPSKGYDPIERVLMSESDDVDLPHTGTVVSYTIITPVQYYGQKETEPYIRASILLDGADQPLGQQDIREIAPEDFRAGLRVRAIFRSEAERSVEGMDNRWGSTGNVVERWEPTGEPDVPFAEISEHAY